MTVVTRILIGLLVWLALLLQGRLVAAQEPTGGTPIAEQRPAEDLFLRLGSVGLDAARVFHIRDAHIDRSGFYLTLEDGTIGFTEDVLGHVTGALFEGEGEVLVVPPDRAERSSLALFTTSAVLEEKITFGYFRFNDETFKQLQSYLASTGDADAFLSKWGSQASVLAETDSLRLLASFAGLLPSSAPSSVSSAVPTQAPDRFLHGRLLGVKLGAFDLLYDTLAIEQVQVLQLTHAHGASYYDIWMSFNPRRGGADASLAESSQSEIFKISSYKIQTRVTPPRQLEAVATCELNVLEGGRRAFLFELSRFLHVTRVEADGHPLEFIHNPAVDGSQLSRQGDDLIAVVFPRTLRAGEQILLKFVYGGEVLSEEANGLLSVGARGTWYPNRGLQMANFDLSFSYPPGWTLLATGTRALVDNNLSGTGAPSVPEELYSRWISARPIPVAGFNLGRYVKASSHAGNTLVEAYATKEMGLEAPKKTVASAPGKNLPASSPPSPYLFSSSSPAHNVQAVADRAAAAVGFFAARFGEYPYGSLALTQAPGPASQGWPGLVFLSGYAFLSPDELATHNLRPSDAVLAQQTPAHETAHQWWGDLVLWNSYRDQWISEGLASYCALLQLEERDPAAFRLVMDSYRDDLLQVKDGRRMSDAGAVTLGQRLNSSRFPNGYDVIAYGRGAWLFHMLREMLLDEQELGHGHSESAGRDEIFLQVLRHVQEKFAGRGISTRELLQEFAADWPKPLWFENKPSLDWFWDGWIQGTSIPILELKGVKFSRQKEQVWVTGTIVQREAPQDLVTPVPLYAESAGNQAVLLGRIFADGPETVFRLHVPAGTRKLLLDPRQTLLRQR